MQEYLKTTIADTLEVLSDVVASTSPCPILYQDVDAARSAVSRVTTNAHELDNTATSARTHHARTLLQHVAMVRYYSNTCFQTLLSAWRRVWRTITSLDKKAYSDLSTQAAGHGIVFHELIRDLNNQICGLIEMTLIS